MQTHTMRRCVGAAPSPECVYRRRTVSWSDRDGRTRRRKSSCETQKSGPWRRENAVRFQRDRITSWAFTRSCPRNSNKVLKHFFPTLTPDSEATDRPCFSNKWFLYSVTTALVLFACAARLTVNHIIIKIKNKKKHPHSPEWEVWQMCETPGGYIFFKK